MCTIPCVPMTVASNILNYVHVYPNHHLHHHPYTTKQAHACFAVGRLCFF